MPAQVRKSGPPQRPLRGVPDETRERLLTAAMELFNRHGYHGTDSNRIAKAAGYATGTFYKHFKDKREVFLAAYERWAAEEWKAVRAELAAQHPPDQLARRLVNLSLDFHTRWRGLRASLHELMFTDARVKQFCCQQWRQQIDLIAELRSAQGWQSRTREDDALLLYSCERTYDGIAREEPRAMGLNRGKVIEAMVRKVREAFG